MPVVHIRSESDYKTVIMKAASKLVVVDFTAKWCGPCQGIAPFFAKLSDEYRQVAFLKVDVDECQEIAMASNVAAMPTFVFLKDGSEVDRMQGANPNELEAKIKSLAGSAGAAASFEGSGHRLGGTAAAATPPASVDKAGLKQLEEQAQALVGVDESKPTTKVNVRLADGNKLTIRLNTSQPVSVIREFICNAVPDQAYKVFALMTTFPNKEIEDEHLTVEQAKLANAVVMQKMKE